MDFGFKESFTAVLSMSQNGHGCFNVPQEIKNKVENFQNSKAKRLDVLYTIRFCKLNKVYSNTSGRWDIENFVEYTNEQCQKDFNISLKTDQRQYYHISVIFNPHEVGFEMSMLSVKVNAKPNDSLFRQKQVSTCMWDLKNLFPMEVEVTIEGYNWFKLCQHMFSQMSNCGQLQNSPTTDKPTDTYKELEKRITKLEKIMILDDEFFSSALSTPTPSKSHSMILTNDVTNSDIMKEIKDIKQILQTRHHVMS